MTTFLSKLVKRSQTAPHREVVVTADDFRIVYDEKETDRVAWSKVIEVYAFVADRFSYDEVCIAFRLDGANKDAWVGEDDAGYDTLVSALPSHFPGIRSDWYSEVRGPAFVTNRTTLWGTS